MNNTIPKPLAKLITLQALTFLHPGTGQTTGVVDLPVQREIHTGFPMFAASGFKGSLRDKAERLWGKEDARILTTFGSQAEVGKDDPAAGALAVTDARILAFPVRSLQKVFVWVTCPMVLARLKRDATLIGMPFPSIKELSPEKDAADVAAASDFLNPLVLEEIAFRPEKNDGVNQLAEVFIKILHPDSGFDSMRLAIIADDDFQYLVTHATQVATRIKLNDKKSTTGDGGNMWTEETLPPETIFYALGLCHAPRLNGKNGGPQRVADVLEAIMEDGYLQLGGNETVGQGWCCIRVTGGAL
jgi:CRISPR-associated protein Cmr4